MEQQEATQSSAEALLTQRQVAQRLGMSVGFVRQETRAGRLAVVEIGNNPDRPRLRYRPEDVDAYIGARTKQAVVPVNPHGRRRRGAAA